MEELHGTKKVYIIEFIAKHFGVDAWVCHAPVPVIRGYYLECSDTKIYLVLQYLQYLLWFQYEIIEMYTYVTQWP